ncbi:alpha/beta hydrolase [Nonomuraea sp. NPDC003804]|uniref:alpha/beta hydrolase n=1 Tax=Nonomuraea sp. NPDC003804 TaxID=3154547 RepID=UPI0033B52119
MKIVTLPYDTAPPADGHQPAARRSQPDERRRLDLLEPNHVRAPYALCFVHGGGWRAGDRAQWHEQMRAAAGRGVTSASLGYRVGGRLAEMTADVADGYRTLRRRLGDRPVALVGSSAGAHLATLFALSGHGADHQDGHQDGPRGGHPDGEAPLACVSLNGPGTPFPWEGMHPEIAPAVEDLAAEGGRAADPGTLAHAGAPPFLFVVVGRERYFPHAHVHALAALLPSAKVVTLPGAEHGFFYRTAAEGAAAAQAEIDAFLTAALTASSTRTGASSSSADSGHSPVRTMSAKRRSDGSV